MNFNKRFGDPEKPLNENLNCKIEKFYGEGHLVNRLYIHWDLLTKCNFNCSYCFARRDYEKTSRWQKNDPLTTQMLIIEAISRAVLPVFLGLQGGEPTIHPHFEKIYFKIFDKIISKHEDSRLYITSNMSTNVFKKINFIKGTKFLCSLHLEHERDYGENYKKFLENVEYLSTKNYECRVNLMLLPDLKYVNKIMDLYNKLLELGVQIHPHFMYKDSAGDSLLYDYTPEFYEKFNFIRDCNKEYIFESNDYYNKVSDYTLFEKKLNNFKGFDCYNNNYEITFDGRIQNVCKRNSIDLKSNLNYFKNITHIDPMKCPYDVCNCDGMLKILKVKK